MRLAFTWEGEDIGGWMWSEKLDGTRAIWDGGISRGEKACDVAWANDKGYTSTGLFSRYGNVITAPDWWLDKLPKDVCLDGELWLGRGMFEASRSIVSAKVNYRDWSNIKYMVHGFPGSNFNGITLTGKVHYNDVVVKVEEFEVPRTDTNKYINTLLSSLVDLGAEGIMVRNPNSFWTIGRDHNLLKIKPSYDDVCLVTGTNPGKGKYYGMIGSFNCLWNNIQFELSGMTDEIRRNGIKSQYVRFGYSGLTSIGVPRSAFFICEE